MEKEHRTLILGIIASGIIAPTISILITYIIKKIENRKKR